jgi:hypothetical protein
MDQRVDRHEDQGQPARAEHLIGDLDAIALDEALGVRIPRSHGPPLIS